MPDPRITFIDFDAAQKLIPRNRKSEYDRWTEYEWQHLAILNSNSRGKFRDVVYLKAGRGDGLKNENGICEDVWGYLGTVKKDF